MVKVIREVYGTTRCPSCKSLLDYERSDILQDEEVNFDTGEITVKSSVKCPVCLRLIKVFEDFVYKGYRDRNVQFKRENLIDITSFDVMKYRASLY